MFSLNVGCGPDYRESKGEDIWVNIDFDPNIKADLRHPIDKLDELYLEMCDLVLAQDVLEHIVYNDNDHLSVYQTLSSWVRCLKKGGTIQIQVPDPYLILEQLKSGQISELEMNRLIFGENTNIGDRHYQLISLGRLKEMLKSKGLRIIEESRVNICSIVRAIKD